MELSIAERLQIIDQKIDLINETLTILLDRLAEIDEDNEQLLYNERDQTKPL